MNSAALLPIFPLGTASVSIGTAQLIAEGGTVLSFLVSIFFLAADGDLRERAGSDDNDQPPGDIGGH